MLKALVCIGIIVVFSVWCCIRIGSQSDKYIEKQELERPDLIQLQSKQNV